MKIAITETQWKKILNEDLSKNNSYLNSILDKVLDGGIDSLNDEERNALQQMAQDKNLEDPSLKTEPESSDQSIENTDDEGDISTSEDPNTPREINNVPYMLFVDLFPREMIELEVNDDIWFMQIKDIDGINKLITRKSNNSIIEFIPFWEETKIKVQDNENNNVRYLSIAPERVPAGEDEMHRFINDFIKAMPAIIKKTIENYKK